MDRDSDKCGGRWPSQSDEYVVVKATDTSIANGQQPVGEQCKRKCSKPVFVFALLVIAIIIWSVVGITVCYKFVWSPLHDLSSSADVHQCEGNTPILKDFDSFFVEDFFVTQKVKSDIYDSFHTVFVYLLNTACNDLPSNTTTQRYDESSQPPYGPVYMLKNSVISINICASTRNSDNDPLILYILKTVENFLNFDPKHPSKEYYRKHILVGNNGYTNCATISLTLSTDDYYTIYFSPPTGVTLHYNITMTIRQIEVNALNNSTLLGVFIPSNGDQTLKDGIKFLSGRYCLFADIQKSSNATSQDYTTLEVETGPRVNAGAGITATVLIMFLVVVMLSEVLIYFLLEN